MIFEWDEAKNQQNIVKHAISFQDARKIFMGFTLDRTDDRLDYGEERIISIGKAGKATILTVVHTDRHGICRLISARRANRKEREAYEKTIRPAYDVR